MKKIFLILVLLSALLASRHLFKPGFFSMHDDLHVGRLYEMDLCIQDRQFPCRWVPDMGYGYGYPLYNFYPPLPYYLGEAFHLLGFGIITSIKIVFAIAVFFGAYFMFLLASHFWGLWGGLIGAVFYTWVPYHALDIFVRGAMSEFTAIAFFPAIFWVVAEIINKKKKYWPQLAFFYAALLLSHNIMAMLFTPLLGAWVIFLLLLKKKKFSLKVTRLELSLLLKIILSGLWGVGLAAFFTLPAFLEKKLVHVETMFMGYFNYLAHYTSLKQLFLDRFWGFGASVWGPEDGMSFQLGHLHWILALVILGLAVYQHYKDRKKSSLPLVVFCFSLSLAIIFLTHPRAVFIWKAFPFLEYLQFPWRFLAIATFLLSFLAGGIMSFVSFNKRALFAGTLIGAVILLNFNYFQPEKPIYISDQEKLFSEKGWNRLQTDAIFDYLPKSAFFPPTAPAPKDVLLREGSVENRLEVKNFEQGTDWLKFKISIQKEGEIMLPVYYFPGWRGWLDKKEVELTYEKDLGRIIMEVPAGEHQGELRLTNTPVRAWANFISLIAWWSLLVVAFKPIVWPRIKK
ncbi:glycosyltransferase family 39 protein [Candidatus Shapirobacteria bacterium]|nr:glycosyltransferase family 39 protein [Candidatus Shapirobacteria bacterium]